MGANNTMPYYHKDWVPNILETYKREENSRSKDKFKAIAKYVKSVMTKVVICNKAGASELLLKCSLTSAGCETLRKSGATQLLAQFYALRGADNESAEWLNNADHTLDNLASCNGNAMSKWKEMILLKALKKIWDYSRHVCSNEKCGPLKKDFLRGLQKLKGLLKHENYCKTILRMGALVSVALLLEIGPELSEAGRECSFQDDVTINICDILSDALTIQKTMSPESAEARKYVISVICTMPRVLSALCGHLRSEGSGLVLAAVTLIEKLACVPCEHSLTAIGKAGAVPVLIEASMKTPNTGRHAFNALFCLMLGYPKAKEEFICLDLAIPMFFELLQTHKDTPEAKALSGILLSISEVALAGKQHDIFCRGAIDENFLKHLHSPSRKVARHTLGILSTICSRSDEDSKLLIELKLIDRLREMKPSSDQVIVNARDWLLKTIRRIEECYLLIEKFAIYGDLLDESDDFTA